MLADDIARCDGVKSDDGDWREGCDDCLRRTDPVRSGYKWMVIPSPIIIFECEFGIWEGDNG